MPVWGGSPIPHDGLPLYLFRFQERLVAWALRKGRAAIWADTGLGKTPMQLAWASQVTGRTLILAPLCVTHQTVAMGRTFGVTVGRLDSDAQIQCVNYERLHEVNPARYEAVVLDESSILKALDGKTRTRLIRMFSGTPHRLCCTATPAPNDVAELANHCEFLGILTRQEMLATFFVHDEAGWRLRGHARKTFYRWLASWGMFLRRPSDIGESDDGFDLPPLEITEQVVGSDWSPVGGALFPDIRGIQGRSAVRRSTADARVAAAADLILAHDGPWIAWCGMNREQDLLAQALHGESVISVQGSDAASEKEARLLAFLRGDVRILISKARIVGFGLNLQCCAQMVFVGIGDSFEQYYQCLRRCWRFGQTSPVRAWIVVSDHEGAVVANVKRKEVMHARMCGEMIANMADAEMEELGIRSPRIEAPRKERFLGERWELRQGDCVEELQAIAPQSVDFSVYSPPFQSLFTYTASPRDLGNNATPQAFLEHFGYAVRGLLRVTKLGRLTACHIAQVTTTKVTHGVIGMTDLRGDVIRAFVKGGWIFHGEIFIDKDPQAQAIRTHSKALLFVQLRKDSSWLRPALADSVVLFRAPGENAVPIHPDISNDEWIEWARPIWYGIRESDTLQAAEARGNDDDRHICPLQLGTIERCVRLWSNPGELVLSPFAGIGSEGWEAIRLGRRFLGIELKSEYARVAVKNLQEIERRTLHQLPLFGSSNGGESSPEGTGGSSTRRPAGVS